MSQPFKGVENIDIKDSVPDWEPYTQPMAPEGAPSVLYIVLDDVGFSAMEPYGGLIETPNMKRIADRGLTYTNFHTTALCSPTRSCMLTGRNHTRTGWPASRRRRPASRTPTATSRSSARASPRCSASGAGTRTWSASGTCAAEDEMNLASLEAAMAARARLRALLRVPRRRDQPVVSRPRPRQPPVEQPASPEEGYHLTVDLTDQAIEFIQDAKAVAPDKPFFLVLLPGRRPRARTTRPKEWADKYKGKFDMGYEAYREQVFERQKELGIVCPRTPSSPRSTRTSTRRATTASLARARPVRPWDSLTDDEKRLFARMAEVYAGFLSHADHEIGRLLDYLEQSGQLDNTIVVVVSDNGASGEGGPNGSVNEKKILQRHARHDRGEPAAPRRTRRPRTYNHYPTGWAWAFNTPFKMWKRYANYEGGTADPLIVSWPDGIKRRAIRTPVHPRDRHRADAATSASASSCPDVVNGYTQKPLEGVSFADSFDDARGADTEDDAVLLDARHARRSGTRAGRPRPRCPRRPSRGATSTSSAGSSSTPTRIPANATTWPSSTPRSCRS